MQRAGEAVRTAQGLLILRSSDEEFPDVGSEIVDESLTSVGTLVDVFGPVECPYLAVSPDDDRRPVPFVGATLYARRHARE
ncbi:MAG: RNA-binding protein [Halobacteriales archaeon]|jgi:RNA-binding protein